MTESAPDKPGQPEQGDTPPSAAPAPGKTVNVNTRQSVEKQTGGQVTGASIGEVNADEVNISSVNTGGGDYAEGDVDKRQGLVVEGGTVTAQTIIGQQNVYPAAPTQGPIHQLRAPVGDFVGREREIAVLVATLRKAATGEAAAVISGVRGMGGIGKTELAYKVAHELRDVFPDGALLVELRGTTNPLTPEQALQSLLLTLDPQTRPPDDISQLQVLYRQKLAGKKLLVLADDALDAKQVRPLMPPTGCALLVTSRNRFSLLGMVILDLEMLAAEAAEALVLEICPRIGEHAPKLAKLCGYLPLALRVSASLLRENPSRGVARYLEQLQEERLKHLKDSDNPDDPQASVEASLRLSYEALEPTAQSVFCQLSVFPTSFWLEAARAIVVADSDVDAAMESLRRRSLAEWNDERNRYYLHDLVRELGKVHLEDSSDVGLRHAKYYLLVANHAENNLFLQGDALRGLALFDQERAHIDAGWEWAKARVGEAVADALVVSYVDVTANIAELRYDQRYERLPMVELALEVARRRGEREREGTLITGLGSVHRNLKDAESALSAFTRRLEIAQELNNVMDVGLALGSLGNVYADSDMYTEAIDHYLRAIEIAQVTGSWRNEAKLWGNLATAYKAMSDPQRAFDCHKKALKLAHENRDEYQEKLTFWNIGVLFEEQGDLEMAARLMRAWVPYARAIKYPKAEAQAARLLRVVERLERRQPPASAETPPSS